MPADALVRRLVNIDTATLAALELLATDRKSTVQDLVEEALVDLLNKHGRPVTTKDMFAASLTQWRRRKRG